MDEKKVAARHLVLEFTGTAEHLATMISYIRIITEVIKSKKFSIEGVKQ